MRNMETPDFDVAILGAGPVGSALALALARKAPDPSRIALIAPARPASHGSGHAASTGVDPRSLALNHGSRIHLETLSAWPDNAADILQVHVSQRHR
ncbi:MAG: FAD-dependent oxidoreductase, partial [Burkholderiaceae bacterium]